MSVVGTTSYSCDGPQCPKCGFTFTPDESFYYEPRYTEDTCQECGCKFSVEVHHSVSWECAVIPHTPTPKSAQSESEAG